MYENELCFPRFLAEKAMKWDGLMAMSQHDNETF